MSTIRRDAARAARVTDLRIEAVDHLAGDRGRGLPAEATLFDHRHDHIVGLVGVGTNHRGEPRRVLLVRPLGGPGLARDGDLRERESLEGTGGCAALHHTAERTPDIAQLVGAVRHRLSAIPAIFFASDPSGAMTRSTTWGVHRWPPLAIAPYARANCRGVTWTYPDPIIVRISPPGTHPYGNNGLPYPSFAVDAQAGSGTSPVVSDGRSMPVGASNPHWCRSAWSGSALAPSGLFAYVK